MTDLPIPYGKPIYNENGITLGDLMKSIDCKPFKKPEVNWFGTELEEPENDWKEEESNLPVLFQAYLRISKGDGAVDGEGV